MKLEARISQAERGSREARTMLGPVREDIRETLRIAWLDPWLEACAQEPVFFAAAWSAIRPSVGRSFLSLARGLRERGAAVASTVGATNLLPNLTSSLTPEELARVGESARAAHLAAAKSQIVLHLFLRAARRERTRGTGQEEPPSRRGVPEWQRWMTAQPAAEGSEPTLVLASERFGTKDAPPALRPFARWPTALEALWGQLEPVIGSSEWRLGATAIRRSLLTGLEGLPHPVSLQWAALYERGFDESARRRVVEQLEAVDDRAAGQTVASAFAWSSFGAQDLGQEG
jgi:hypothetical protein